MTSPRKRSKFLDWTVSSVFLSVSLSSIMLAKNKTKIHSWEASKNKQITCSSLPQDDFIITLQHSTIIVFSAEKTVYLKAEMVLPYNFKGDL